ncbi:MAG: glycosyltransferase family 4 protein [Bacteroidales bacterium]|nr:glycosyltransferase family 4 protein [Bacteroidales bacterium]
MKILLVNKSDKTGGAAVACKRLHTALNKVNVDAHLMVEEKKTNDEKVIDLSPNHIRKKLNFIRFAYERLYFLPFEHSKELRFAFSPACAGQNIHRHPAFINSDIIHLHWFNQGFLSLNSLKNIVHSGKPIVWTLHDMWAFTGGCHYAGECFNYQQNCGNCPFLKNPKEKDLSYRILKKKISIFKNANITFVTCSKWLKDKAQESALLKNFKILNIPNPINTEEFYPTDKIKIRKKLKLPNNKKLLLFAAANINDKRKGLKYLIEALQIYHSENQNQEIEIITFGKSDNRVFKNLSYKVHHLGILSKVEAIAGAYNAADVFILPSLEDNLPNTIMEALACGTPVLAFRTGGIPEMIEHKKNGYLAEYKSVNDLKNGIEFILNHPQKNILSKNALEKVKNEYSEEIVAKKYFEVYNYLLENSVKK